MRKIWDISLPIGPDMLVWPGDPPVRLLAALSIAAGDAANVSELRLGTHTGTHVDPPSHFIDGAAAADALPLDVLIGEAVVVEVGEGTGTIGPSELEAAGLVAGDSRVLFKTSNSAIWPGPRPEFPAEYVAVEPEGATWIVEHGVRLVGVDFLSVERPDSPGHPAHLRLLGAGVVVVEGLDLSAVPPGRYTLVCLPLRIAGGDGAPARAVLLEG